MEELEKVQDKKHHKLTSVDLGEMIRHLEDISKSGQELRILGIEFHHSRHLPVYATVVYVLQEGKDDNESTEKG